MNNFASALRSGILLLIVTLTVTPAVSLATPTLTPATSEAVSETTATLVAKASNPGGRNTAVWFEWGETPNPTMAIAMTDVMNGGYFQGHLSNLAPGTTYYFRAVAMEGGVTTYSPVTSFTTRGSSSGTQRSNTPANTGADTASTPALSQQIAAQPPILTPVATAALSETTVTLVAKVSNPGWKNTTVWFEWGETQKLGKTAGMRDVVNEGYFQGYLNGLSPGTIYYFRAVAKEGKKIAHSPLAAIRTLGGSKTAPLDEAKRRADEERKRQEVIAKQEQENAAYWAKRDQEVREIRARAEEEDKKQRAKYEEERNRQEEERLANLAKQEQATREARARADEEQRQREAQARSNTASPASPPVVSTQPTAQQSPQVSPQVVTQQPTKGQNTVSPGLGTPPSSETITVPQHSPQIVIQQPAKGPVSPSLGANSPSLPTQNSSNQQMGQSNASREPANNTQLHQVSSVTKQNQTRSPVTPPANHQAQSPTYQQVLTPAEITWMNSLPPDDATKKLPPSTIARMKREGKWAGYVAGTNNANQSIAQDKKDQARYEQRAETILKTAETAGEVAQGALTVIPGGGVVGAGEKVVAKVIEKKAERDAVKTAVTRGVDAASTGGITKTVTKMIDPTDIRFSQSTISRNFNSGSSIDELAAGLRSGAVKPSEIPPIRLVEKDGQLFTLDNRRLEAFRRAGVKVPYRMATPQEIEAEAWKFTTSNGGTSTRIRGN